MNFWLSLNVISIYVFVKTSNIINYNKSRWYNHTNTNSRKNNSLFSSTEKNSITQIKQIESTWKHSDDNQNAHLFTEPDRQAFSVHLPASETPVFPDPGARDPGFSESGFFRPRFIRRSRRPQFPIDRERPNWPCAHADTFRDSFRESSPGKLLSIFFRFRPPRMYVSSNIICIILLNVKSFCSLNQ